MARTPAVPYCTVKGFRACLELLRRDPVERLDRDMLVARGFSQHAAYPVLGAFRFLGLMDESGRLLPTLACFLEDDIAARRTLVEACYRDVLADLKLPVEEREVVDRLLVDRHGVAPGVAPFCSTFMLWIAAECGLPVADASRSRRGRPPAHLAQLSATARALLMPRAALELPASAQAVGAHLPPELPAPLFVAGPAQAPSVTGS